MVDATLRDYALQIDTGESGAILFCVVNGKMSEGINFSDRLGRYVGEMLFVTIYRRM
jgi:chromosome transmission fidelity protein 1